MSRLLQMMLLVGLVPVVLGQGTEVPCKASDVEQEHQQWMVRVLQSVADIKPGLTRNDLSKFFTGEGGLATRTQRTYVRRDCPYIKMNVMFAPASHGGKFDEMPDDVIVKVSQPYLGYAHYD
jgi:hypothetical protein